MLATDIIMPRMDGTTLISTIGANQRFATTSVVIMADFIDVKEISNLLELGATWFVPKPVDRRSLESISIGSWRD